MGSAVAEDAYCLKWNDFHTSITATFSDLRNESDLLDAVIVCEGQQLQAHRLVLSACSGVFRQLFRMSAVTKSDHPVVLLWDVKADDLKLLFNFMYEGQVNVAQEHLTDFLALAERLQVRGLTSSDNNKHQNLLPLPQPIQHVNNRQGALPTVVKPPPIVSPTSSRRLRSSPMGLVAGLPSAKRVRTSHLSAVEDSSANEADLDDMPLPPPVKQELKIDETSSVFPPSVSGVVGSNSVPAFDGSGPNSSFNPFYPGMNPDEGDEDFDSKAGPSSSEGYGIEAEAMLEEGPKGSVVVGGSLTVSHGHGVGGMHAGGIHVPSGFAQIAAGRSSANNSGICQICHKSFRQLRSHIADVHIPTPTPCPLCGKIFSSKHKMFGHKYRSCPNRTKNLVRHLELLDHNHPHLQQQLLLQQQQLQPLTTNTPPPAPPLPPVSQHF